jgi:hypothetical protein
MWLRARRTIRDSFLRGILEEVMGSEKFSQFLNLVIAADLRRRSYLSHFARRTRSKFALLWPRCG